MATTGHENESINVGGLKTSLQALKNKYNLGDTVLTTAQSLTTAQKDQAVSNILDKSDTSGMKRIVLKKTDNFKTVVEGNSNTIFVIKYNYTLTADVNVPASCILQFDGGSIDTTHHIKLNNNVKVLGGNIICHGNYIFDITSCSNVIIDGVIATNQTNDTAEYLVRSSDVGTASNITIKDCKCYNLGIIYNGGTFKNSATYNYDFFIINNFCKISGRTTYNNTTTPTGVMLCYTHNFYIAGNIMHHTYQGVTIWGGDGVHYNGWLNTQTNEIYFGASHGIVDSNQMYDCCGSAFFTALALDVIFSNNICKRIKNECLDAEFSKDITFFNNIIWGSDAFTIFGYYDNIVYDSNRVYLPEDYTESPAYFFRAEPCTSGVQYGDYEDLLGKCYIRNNYIDSDDNISRIFTNGYVEYEITGNFIKNMFSYGGSKSLIIKNNTFLWTRNRDSSSYSIIRLNNDSTNIIEGNTFKSTITMTSHLITLADRCYTICRNNFFDLYDLIGYIFIAYGEFINRIRFEDNIFNSQLASSQTIDLIEKSGQGASMAIRTYYRNNLIKESNEDILFEPHNSVLYDKTKKYCVFSTGSIIPTRLNSDDKIIVGYYCSSDGTLVTTSYTGVWKNILL